jgi:hypothetical protein
MRRSAVLCTHCSRRIAPVVAIDIDGTMGDYHGHFMEFALQYLYGGKAKFNPVDEYEGNLPMREWFCRRLKVKEEVWRDIKLAYRQGGLKRSMPAYSWAHTLTYVLRSMGIEVWVTTTRPYLRMDNIDPDTRFWLEDNSIQFDHLLYDEDKYSQLLDIVGIDRVVAVIDDLNEDLQRAANLFGEEVCFMRRARHNTTFHQRWPGSDHANDIQHFILGRVQAWNARHEGEAA